MNSSNIENREDSLIQKNGKGKLQPTDEKTSDFYVVGLGASAGGLEALEKFFTNMPETDNMVFVVIQHLSPDYKSYMPELLSKRTEMNVYHIQDGMEITPGCIYLNPPKYNVVISDGKFQLIKQRSVQRVNLAIDTFFESLAKNIREKAIGIILSGTGSDGTIGCRAIKEAGGIVMVQDDTTAKFDGMPKSVIIAKIYDYILAPQLMPSDLLNYTVQPSLLDKETIKEKEKDAQPDILTRIYNILKKRYSVDFSLYKQSTMLRCIDRRMKINQILDPNSYLDLLYNNMEEVENLYNNLLIGVTRFFRDKEAFNVMKEKVIPQIVNSKIENSTIRIWIAGCSTGEEAYSLAILLKEYMDAAENRYNIKIFATDIDNNAIQYASDGFYPHSISHDVSPEHLSRFFIKKKNGYLISKTIRDMVIFSSHNVINNPPFFKIDLISCRNLLIYFQSSLQVRVISTFQFALNTNGFLFLGNSETTGKLNKYFSTVDAKHKIFKRKETKKRPLVDDLSIVSTGVKVFPQTNNKESKLEQSDVKSMENNEIYEKLINDFMPPSVLVDLNGELVQVCGDSDKFLRVPRGRVNYQIQKMVPKELSTAIGTAIGKVKKEKITVTYSNIKVKLREESVNINLVFKPVFTRKNGTLILILFDENRSCVIKDDHIDNYDTISELHERIQELEQELIYTKESLQTSIEEIETSSEELQSANEELLISNEELHSTNEELQSVNEELMVVNNQYQHKIQELDDLNSDMTNFINSTTIGTIFLDLNMCIRKFTPSITNEVNLIESDIGRPMSHISHGLKDEDLVKEAKKVVDTLIPFEREVQSENNKWYILKFAPYRTNENVIKGVVISLIDITDRKEAEEDLEKSKERYEDLIELLPFAVFIEKDNIIQFANTEGVKLFQGKNVEHVIGKNLKKYLDFDKFPLFNKQNKYVQYKDKELITLEDKITRPDGSEIDVEVIATPITFEEENAHLLMFRDISYKDLADKLHKENEKKKQLLEEAKMFDGLKNDFFSNLSHELRTPLNVIMSTIQLLEAMMKNDDKYAVDSNVVKYMGIMKQNCFRQLRLINNLIDITKIDSGFFKVELENHNIINMVEDITLSVAEYIKTKSLNLIFDTDVEEKVIACDPTAIERIILNLLSNAVKFTNHGGSINVNMYDRGERIKISVKDTGIGISQEKLDIVFERFRQVDKSYTRKHEGSGIGLSLVKSLVDMHEGSIDVKSEYGKGTEFIIELPVKTLDENDKTIIKEEMSQSNYVEKINIEFSDIYNLS